jgi:hypothetical protein
LYYLCKWIIRAQSSEANNLDEKSPYNTPYLSAIEKAEHRNYLSDVS